MGAVLSLARGALKLRPFVGAVTRADLAARRGGALAVLPGDPAVTDRLREILGVPATDPPRAEGLLVHPAVASADLGGPGRALALHRAGGGRALAILIGGAAARERMGRTLLVEEGLGLTNVAHVASLEGPGEEQVLRAVAEALGPEAIAAGRVLPRLRPAVADLLVARAARRAGAIGAVPIGGAAMPAITLVQVRLVAELAALHDREIGPERVPEIAAIVAAGFGWRALAREALVLVPGPGWAIKAGVAYAATRAVGEGSRRWLAERGEAADRPLTGLRAAIERAIGRGPLTPAAA